MPDTFEMLQELLEQDQFELLTEEKEGQEELRVVYLMNDAVESFLLFRNAVLTGNYQKDYKGSLKSSLSQEDGRYVLVVWQGDQAATVFFQDLDLEVHLYDYGAIGHFWMPGYEYLRQIEYKTAIVRDKLEYLGACYCTEEEQRLSCLADFPPLNYCCYPAVPFQYIVPKQDPWVPTEAAIHVMIELAEEAGDKSMVRLLRLYGRFSFPVLAKYLARKLHQNRHGKVVDLISEKLREEAAHYPVRSFGKEADEKLQELLDKAEKMKEKLARQGVTAQILREEPFTTAKDSLEVQVYLMVWEKGRINRKTVIRKLSLPS